MSVQVRCADMTDFDTVVQLIAALADYEKLPPPDEAARRRLKRDGWPDDGRAPRFKVWIAETCNDGQAVPVPAGYAITFETYSSFLAKPTLYIEDIFVLPEFRRSGVGSELFLRLVAEAQTNDCGRVEWVVLDWNTGAQQFYQRHGASHLEDWQYYRLDLARAAAQE
jgi:GNAT superfamily N-acetyltransferase